MTLEEFLKTIYHTRLYIIVPCLNRMKINKELFFNKGKYDIQKQNEYLKELYYEKVHKN